MVFVFAVLTVQDLRGDGHRRMIIEHRHVEGHHRQMALSEGDHPPAGHLDVFAAGSSPQDFAGKDARGEVQASLVFEQIGGRQEQRHVVDILTNDIHIWLVYYIMSYVGTSERNYHMDA